MFKTKCIYYYILSPSIFLICEDDGVKILDYKFIPIIFLPPNSVISHSSYNKDLGQIMVTAPNLDISRYKYINYISNNYQNYSYKLFNNYLYRMPRTYKSIYGQVKKHLPTYLILTKITLNDIVRNIILILVDLILTDFDSYYVV